MVALCDHERVSPVVGSLYGRRKGKLLSKKRQALVDAYLPNLLVPSTPLALDLEALFPSPPQELWFEIGFGGGEHLAQNAQEKPHIGFIGAEPFFNGLANLVRYIHEQQLENIRLWQYDARVLLERFPDKSLSCVFALFQDPWPKNRHVDRRIINKRLLDILARVMKPGAVFGWATDHPVFLKWSLEHCLSHPDFTQDVRSKRDWLQRPDDWYPTRYEAKAVKEGRVPHYFKFMRKHN